MIEKTLRNLEKHFFDARYFDSIDNLKTEILSLLKEYRSFSFGGSMTLTETGLRDFIIENGKIHIERNTSGSEEEKLESERKCLLSDIYFCSANAISADGEIVNIDKRGNRVGALVFGPKKVVVIAGTNKVS
ncbi:MAG: lactate utilization protein, partial [bacterium]|nr:lactate utilization protein [bacterium]